MTQYQCRMCVHGYLAKRSFRCNTKIYGKDSDILISIFRDENCPSYLKEKRN